MADPRRTVEVLLSTQNRMRPGLNAGTQDLRTFATGGIRHLEALGSRILSLRNLIAGGILGAAVNRLTAEGDRIGDLSTRMAVTPREYQVLQHAAELTGASAAEVEVGFRTMASVLYDAGEESKRARDAIEGLGLNLDALRNMRPYEQFQAIAQALARVDSETTRAALAQDIYGRGGLALIPMIRETRGELDALAARMEKRGQFLTDEQIATADKFRDSLVDLNRAISVAAFDAIGNTIQDLTRRIMDLVESGKLKEWGTEAATVVTALASAVGRIADMMVRHKDGVIALASSYAGLKIALGALEAIAMARIALGGLAAAQTAAAVATDAHTAAMARQTAETEAAAIESWTWGINRATAATREYAATFGPLRSQVVAVGGALNAVALAGATAFGGWGIGRLIGEATGLTDLLGDREGRIRAGRQPQAENSAMRSWIARYGSPDARNAQGRTFAQWLDHARQQPSGVAEADRQSRGPVRFGPSYADAAKEAREAELKQWEALRNAVVAVWTAARVGQQTGNDAAVELWRKVSGQTTVAAELSAGDIAAAGARLRAVVRDDAAAAVEVLRAAGEAEVKAIAEAEVKAIAEAAEERQRAVEAAADARERLAEMGIQETRREALDAVTAAEEAARAQAAAMRDYADRLEASANREGGRARKAWANLVAGKPADGRSEEDRDAARDSERNERRLERRARDVIARLREGLPVTSAGRGIAAAYVARMREEEQLRRASAARTEADASDREADRQRTRGRRLQERYAAHDTAAERQRLMQTIEAGRTAASPAVIPATPAASPAVIPATPAASSTLPPAVPKAPPAVPAPAPGRQTEIAGDAAVAYLSQIAATTKAHTPILERMANSQGMTQ